MNKRRFAVSLIETQFGPVASKVVEVLLNNEQSMLLSALVKASKFSEDRVKGSMLALMQHNVLYHEEDLRDDDDETAEVGKKRKKATSSSASKQPDVPQLYGTNLSQILPRCRFPLYLLLVAHGLNSEAEAALQLFILHGKRRRSQACNRLVEENFAMENTQLVETEKLRPEKTKLFDAALDALVEAQYLISVRNDESPYDGNTFLTLNYASLDRDLLKREMAMFIDNELAPDMGHIVRAMIHDYEDVISNIPRYISYEEILDLVNKVPAIGSDAKTERLIFNEEKLNQAVMEMAQHTPPYVKKTHQGVSVNTDVILRHMRDRDVFSVMREKYGLLGGRIYQLLHRFQCMEEKQITDLATRTKESVRSTLYNMLQHNTTKLREISRTADRTPSRSIYLWELRDDLEDVLLDSVYFSLANLSIRLRQENERMRPIVTKGAALDMLSPENQALVQSYGEYTQHMIAAIGKLAVNVLILEACYNDGTDGDHNGNMFNLQDHIDDAEYIQPDVVESEEEFADDSD